MKILKTLHHIFFGFIAYIAAGYVMAAITSEIEIGLAPVPGVLLAMSVFLLASAKIMTFKHRHMLRGGSRLFWQKRYIISAACVFAALLAACVVYMQVVDMNTFLAATPPEGMAVEEWVQLQKESGISLMVLLLGCWCLWILFFNLLFVGAERSYPQALVTFIKKYVGVYLVYRLTIFLLTLVSALLMGLGQGGIQGDYFLFVLDDALVQNMATGFLSGSGTFLAGMTAASSFFVLSTLAEESITETGESTFWERFRRMFLDLDTVKLLIMTIICVVTGLMSMDGEMVFFEKLLSSFLVIFWAMSLVSFVADTKVIAYLINFAAMGFIERLIPTPELAGFGGFLLAVIVTVVRIGLFAAVALMIANDQIYRKKQARTANSVGKLLSEKIRNATFLDVILLLLRVSEKGLRGIFKVGEPTTEEEDVRFIVKIVKKVDDFLIRLLKLPQEDEADS